MYVWYACHVQYVCTVYCTTHFDMEDNRKVTSDHGLIDVDTVCVANSKGNSCGFLPLFINKQVTMTRVEQIYCLTNVFASRPFVNIIYLQLTLAFATHQIIQTMGTTACHLTGSVRATSPVTA